MAREFNGHDFARELYLRSEPSVDLDTAESINCTEHKLSTVEYEKILQEFGVTDEQGEAIDHERLIGCNMWVLNQGPSLYKPESV
jgi:hypothetical protein